MRSITEQAIDYCQRHAARLTLPRQQVLDVLVAAGKPIGAYDILAAMPAGTKPPTVYRALEFWQEAGFVHRIGSMNLYVVCAAGHTHHGAQFLICDGCGHVDEAHDCQAQTPSFAQPKGFQVTSWLVELHGLCASCNKQTVKTCSTGCSHG